QQFHQLALSIVNAISGAPVSVTRLSHAAGVDEIFFAGLDANVLAGLASDTFVANENHWHMRVAEKTNCRALISETSNGIEIIEHVAPLPWRIERGVHDRKIVDPPLQWQAAQPFLILLIQMFARPLNGALGQFVEAFRRRREGRLFVVITFNPLPTHFPHTSHPFLRISLLT